MFTNTFATLSQQASDLQSDIKSLEQQLEIKRQSLAELENYLQAFRTATSAAETALSQVTKAIALLKSVAPDNLSEFKAELLNLFDTPKLSDNLSDNNTDNPTEVIEVEIDTTSSAPSAEGDSDDKDKPAPEDYLTYKDLMALDYGLLKKIAANKGVETNGSKPKLASRLKGLVSPSDITPAPNNT